MKHLSFLAVVISICTSSLMGAQTGLREIPMAEVQAAFDRPLPQHPRLLMTDAQLAEIQARLKSSPALQVFYRAVLEKADTIIPQKPVRRIQTGRRLLSVSRTCLDRVLHLSTAYRLSHRRAYLARAEQEMLAAAGFSDWNPSHFLDVAEMTAALALGYDWLYADLPETSRATIRRAILEKGIQPSRKNTGWVRSHNNWNQVCNAGITLGILALAEDRLAPLALLWRQGESAAPEALCWRGRGSNPVAMFRSSWTAPEAVYLAIKGGSPGVSHGHLDVGSFVIDAGGLRWAADLGPENYHRIESRGMDLWGKSQEAQRGTIFRYYNLSHNTLAVNGQHQRVQGSAPMIRYSDRKAFPHVVFDMSRVYAGQLAQALRGAALLPNGQILIQDEFQAIDRPATVRWAMVTPAAVSVEDDRNALLKQEGKTMRLAVLTDAKVQLQTYSTVPPAAYDAPNPGTRMIGFEVTLSAGQAARTAVLLNPSTIQAKMAIDLQPLLQWSAPQEVER